MIWFVKSRRAQNVNDYETWIEGGVSPTLNAFDNGNDTRATVLILAYDPVTIGPLTASGMSRARGTETVESNHILVFTAQRVGEPPRIYHDITPSLLSRMGTGGNNTPMIVDPLYAFDTQFGSNANVFEDQSPTLKGSQQSPTVAFQPGTIAIPIQDGREINKHQNGLGVGNEGDPAYTIDTTGSQAVCTETTMCFQPGTMVRLGGGVWEEIAPTLRAEAKRGDNEPHIAREEPLVFPSTFSNSSVSDDGIVPTLTVGSGIGVPSPPAIATWWDGSEIAPALTRNSENQRMPDKNQLSAVLQVAPTLTATNNPSRSPQSTEVTKQIEAVFNATTIVRRLTPVECERLMGWPDNHTLHRTDGKTNSDSTRYKMCGNGVATPVAQWIAEQLLPLIKQ